MLKTKATDGIGKSIEGYFNGLGLEKGYFPW